MSEDKTYVAHINSNYTIVDTAWTAQHCPNAEQHPAHVWGWLTLWGEVATPNNSFVCSGMENKEAA